MLRDGFLLFETGIEVTQPGEAESIEQIVSSIARTGVESFEKHSHAIRQQHAKSHGILKGELTVLEGLPSELQQGLFGTARSYPVMVRFSTALGDIRSDRIHVPRGMALKVLGVEGTKMLTDDMSSNQDLLLVNHKSYFSDVGAYLSLQRTLELQPKLPDAILIGAGFAARGIKRVFDAVGARAPMAIVPIADPGLNILGETYYSQAPLRYGDFIARISAVPISDSLRPLIGAPTNSNENALRTIVEDFFRQYTAEYEIRAQLCVDPKQTPIEDASIEWPEELSPPRPVGRLRLPPQKTFSEERQTFGDILSFSPFRCLDAHQPLGSIMRVRKEAYRVSSVFRRDTNRQPAYEPTDICEIPD